MHATRVLERDELTVAARVDESTEDLARPGLRPRQVAAIGFLLLPGIVTAYLAFRTGGYYAEASSSVLVLAAAGLLLHALIAERPFAGFSLPLAVAVGALTLLVGWTLLSSGWSDAPGRAALEAQRTGLYLCVLALFGASLRPRGGVSVAVAGVALAIVGVSVAALAIRLFPDVFTAANTLSPERLSFPITYWNALGAFAGVGVVLLLHLACDERGHPLVRALGAAGVPITATVIYFTFSRGATGAVAIGVLAYLVVARPRGAIAGLLATLPPTYLAVRGAYDAGLLGEVGNASRAAVDQGHEVANTVIVAAAAAAAIRLMLVPLDTKLAAIQVGKRRARSLGVAALAALVLAGAAAALALDVPDRVDRAFDSYGEGVRADDVRTRFRDVQIGGRTEHWDVAMEYYRADRLTGAGAGTYETQWLRSRPSAGETNEAHSLYVEMLAELGIVGLVLLVAVLGAIMVGLLMRARGKERAVYGAIFAASLMWAVHAGFDWDWELPAVSLWLFALAGLALARTAPRDDRAGRLSSRWGMRIGVAVVFLLVGMTAFRTVISDAALDDAQAAFEAGDCTQARSDALTSVSAVGSRAEPFQLLAYCELERGREPAALEAMQEAARLDPDNWQYRYGLALVRGASGRDPRPDLRRARRLNPLGGVLRSGAAAELLRAGPRRWERLAAEAARPVDG
jgi:hypothetical protein